MSYNVKGRVEDEINMYKTNERRAVIIMRVKSEATMHFIKQPTS